MDKFLQVSTEYGPIVGIKSTSILGREYFSFRKIPYMKTPIGKLRFVDPVPPEKWEEPLDCTKEGPPFCNIFFKDQKYQGELSGVHINVYTKSISPKKPLPVLVCIHSGGLLTGNATEDFNGPDYFMENEVVLVNFQYRIGVFGFLSLDNSELNIPGNAQFRDHIMALKWIQKNISNFGGDPQNVTILGESWGGGSASYHMLTDKSKGLFHRAVLMSGNALNNLYTFYPKRDWAARLCAKMGYEGPRDDKSMLEFLENADEREIVMVSAQVLTSDEKNVEAFSSPFGPTIESYDNGNAFLTDDIIKMARTGWGNDIDIIIGNTSNEMVLIKSLLAKVPAVFSTYENFQRYVPRELNLAVNSDERIKLAGILKNHYYGDKEVTPENGDGLLAVNNDFILNHAMYRILSSRLKNGTGKSYAYRFDYVTKNNCMRNLYKVDESFEGAAHGDDCSFIFRMKGMEGENFSLNEDPLMLKGIKLMTGIITNFATTGNPNGPELKDISWTPVTLEAPFFGLNINEKGSKMMELPEYQRLQIFNKLFEEQNTILY